MLTYDEAKRLRNLKLHGFDFIGVEAVFAGNTVTREDQRAAYSELRLQSLGLWGDVMVFVVHTPRGEDDHIVSIRKADKHEQRTYWKKDKDRKSNGLSGSMADAECSRQSPILGRRRDLPQGAAHRAAAAIE